MPDPRDLQGGSRGRQSNPATTDRDRGERSLRVLFFNNSYWPTLGGVEVQTRHLAGALRDRGHAVAVVANLTPDLPAVSEVDGVGVHRFAFDQTLSARAPREMASLIAQVALLKQEFQPDIVHVNFPASAAFHHLQSIRPGEATVALFHCALDDWPQIWPLARSLAETADAVAVPSRFLAGNVAAVLSKPPEAFRVIEHGVPEAPLVSISPLPELPSPRFLFAGRLALKKGLIVGFAAIEALARRGIAAELAVAGAGPLDSMLATLPADPVLADRVIVLGELSPDRLVKCLSAATALLVPSLSKESFSLISAEAALAGRPVLASRRGALAETVVDGETGLLFEPGAPTSLADAMQRVLFEPGLAARLGSAARERARSRYGLSLMVDRYETLYRDLAKRPA